MDTEAKNYALNFGVDFTSTPFNKINSIHTQIRDSRKSEGSQTQPQTSSTNNRSEGTRSAKYFKTTPRYKQTIKKDAIISKSTLPIDQKKLNNIISNHTIITENSLLSPSPNGENENIKNEKNEKNEKNSGKENEKKNGENMENGENEEDEKNRKKSDIIINKKENEVNIDHIHIINKLTEGIYQSIIKNFNEELNVTSPSLSSLRFPLASEDNFVSHSDQRKHAELYKIIKSDQRYHGLLSAINLYHNIQPTVLLTPEDNINDDDISELNERSDKITASNAHIYLNDTTKVYNKYFKKFDINLYEKPPNIKEVAKKALQASKNISGNTEYKHENTIESSDEMNDIIKDCLENKRCIYLGLWDQHSNLPHLKPFSDPNSVPFYIYHTTDPNHGDQFGSNVIFYEDNEWNKLESFS